MEQKEIRVIIPRMCGKRKAILATAMQKAKEGYTVLICDLGSGQETVFKPPNIAKKETAHS